MLDCHSLVRALVCQPSVPGSIPGMSRSETAITRGNPIMLLPPTTFSYTTCLSKKVTKKDVFKMPYICILRRMTCYPDTEWEDFICGLKNFHISGFCPLLYELYFGFILYFPLKYTVNYLSKNLT